MNIEINNCLNHHIAYKNDVPVLTRREIDSISEEILKQNMPEALTNEKPVNIEHLIENNFNLCLDFHSIYPDGSILGETVFRDGYREVYDFDKASDPIKPKYICVKKGTIIIDEGMATHMESRTAFTEAHELGHWFLHNRFYSSNTERACRSFSKQKIYFPHWNTMTPIEWTEWQANAFAAAILLPRQTLRTTLSIFLEKHGLGWKKLSDFSIHKSRELYNEFLHTVANTYQVSFETARIRMNKLCAIRYPN